MRLLVLSLTFVLSIMATPATAHASPTEAIQDDGPADALGEPSLKSELARLKSNLGVGTEAAKVFDKLAVKKARKKAAEKERKAFGHHNALMRRSASQMRKLLARAKALIKRAEKERGIIVTDMVATNASFTSLKASITSESATISNQSSAIERLHQDAMASLQAIQ